MWIRLTEPHTVTMTVKSVNGSRKITKDGVFLIVDDLYYRYLKDDDNFVVYGVPLSNLLKFSYKPTVEKA